MLLLACVLVLLCSCNTAAASFKVYPTILDVARNPGGAALGTVNVALHGEPGQRFRVLIQDVSQRADGTPVFSAPSRAPHSASTWVLATPTTFAGAPDRVQPLQYRVSVPANAEPGDHLAALTVERLGRGGATTAAATEAVAVRLTVRVRGPLRPEARIVGFDVPGIVGGAPLTVSTTVRNTGNATLDFDRADPAALTIRDGSDRRARLPFSGQLFPGQTREFVSRWEDPPLFGHFSAEARVAAGAGSAHEEASFWVIPWRQVGALALVLAAAVLLYLGWRRRRYG